MDEVNARPEAGILVSAPRLMGPWRVVSTPGARRCGREEGRGGGRGESARCETKQRAELFWTVFPGTHTSTHFQDSTF